MIAGTSQLTFADDRAWMRQRWRERMEPRVLELAKRAGPEGIIASDVIAAAIADWGILPGPAPKTDPRRDSWIGRWLAELARAGSLSVKRFHGMAVRRTSERRESHGNAGIVYVHPDYADAQGAA